MFLDLRVVGVQIITLVGLRGGLKEDTSPLMEPTNVSMESRKFNDSLASIWVLDAGIGNIEMCGSPEKLIGEMRIFVWKEGWSISKWLSGFR